MRKILLLILLLASFNVSALSVNLSWVPPVEREPAPGQLTGVPITEAELAGYNVYYTDTQTGDYQKSVFVPGGSTRSYKLVMSGAIQYFVVVTAIDTEGRESVYSAEVSKVFSRPNKPVFKFGANRTPNYTVTASITW